MLDIERFCQDHSLAYASEGHHHCHQGWVQIHCLFCASGQHGFHLGFNLDRGNFNCWRCGSHSSWEVVGAVLGTRRKDLIGRTYAQYSTKREKRKSRTAITRKRSLAPPSGAGPLRKTHKKYLTSRRFSPKKLVKEWSLLGTAGLSGIWNWRVVAPVCDNNGRVVAYLGRSVRENVKPKYRVTENKNCLVDPKELVYGIEKVHNDSVVIVEGMTDVWRMGPGAVALLGISWSTQQANMLRRFKRRFIILDPDPRASARGKRLADMLSKFRGETELIDGLETDPGAMEEKEAKKLMKELMNG